MCACTCLRVSVCVCVHMDEGEVCEWVCLWEYGCVKREGMCEMCAHNMCVCGHIFSSDCQNGDPF